MAVVDAGGNLGAHIRMDDAWMGSIDISINKAFTNCYFEPDAEGSGVGQWPSETASSP